MLTVLIFGQIQSWVILMFTVISFGQITKVFGLLHSVMFTGLIRSSFFGHVNNPPKSFSKVGTLQHAQLPTFKKSTPGIQFQVKIKIFISHQSRTTAGWNKIVVSVWIDWHLEDADFGVVCVTINSTAWKL